MTLPPPAFDRERSIVGRHMFVFRSRDLSVNARTGQAGTFFRTVSATCLDSLGVSRTCVHSQPRWEPANSEVGLLMGNAAGTLAERVQWAFPVPPLSMSLLVRFTEKGGRTIAGGSSILALSDSAGANPRLYLAATSGGQYGIFHHNGTVERNAVMTGTAPSVGQDVVLRAALFGDGSVQIWQSIDGAAETTPGTSTASSLAGSWAASPLLTLNSIGSGSFTHGFQLYHGVVITRGLPTQAQLKAVLA